MGFRRLGFGQTAGVSGEQSAKDAATAARLAARSASNYEEEDEETDYARRTFSNQKGIGSDQYFGRGAYDPHAQREAQERLSSFQGATSISSNQYHGIDESEAEALEESIFSANGLGSLESSARNAVQNVMDATGIDSVDSLQGALRQGALKVWMNELEEMCGGG